MAEAPMIKTFRSGATGLILSLCNEIKLVEHINHSVTWDEKQVKRLRHAKYEHVIFFFRKRHVCPFINDFPR
ncbi:MAG: hypothetical protein ACYCVD_06125 [Desulfitobacteriaceae bacterium]